MLGTYFSDTSSDVYKSGLDHAPESYVRQDTLQRRVAAATGVGTVNRTSVDVRLMLVFAGHGYDFEQAAVVAAYVSRTRHTARVVALNGDAALPPALRASRQRQEVINGGVAPDVGGVVRTIVGFRGRSVY